MADSRRFPHVRKHGSRKEDPRASACSHTDQVNAKSTYHEYYNHTAQSPQQKSRISSPAQQASSLTTNTSKSQITEPRQKREKQTSYEVPRAWKYRNPEIERVMNDPALTDDRDYNLDQHYGYNALATHTHYRYPETSITSYGISRQLRVSNLQGHDLQTSSSSAMARWEQEDQRDGAWSVAKEVGIDSDYDPYNPRL